MSRRPRREQGFTLIELMVVVVIAAILAAIAMPSYRDSVLRSRRTDARVALNDLAQRLERCFTQFGAYDDVNCPLVSPQSSPDGFYSVAILRDATTYTLTATPQAQQADDTGCTELEVDNTGQRTAAGSDAGRCW